MNSWRWPSVLLAAAGCLIVASTAQAQTCTTDDDCAGFITACAGASCLLNVCIADPHPADTPCFIANCREGLCDGSGTCVDAGPSAPGTACNDDEFCTLDDVCDAFGACAGTTPNPDPLCNQSLCPPCVQQSCLDELIACQADAACIAFATCFSACTTGTCITACAAANPSAETDALLACIEGSCSSVCFPPPVPALDVRLHLLLATLIFVSGWALFVYARPSS